MGVSIGDGKPAMQMATATRTAASFSGILHLHKQPFSPMQQTLSKRALSSMWLA